MTDRADIEAVLRAALVDGDVDALASHLDPQVIWGHCHSGEMVMAELRSTLSGGVSITSGTITEAADRFVADLMISAGEDDPFACSVAVFVNAHGQVCELQGPTGADEARTVAPVGPFPEPTEPTAFASVAPVFPVTDVDAAVAHYAALGFATHQYEGAASYGYADRGEVHLHLAQMHGLDPSTNTSAAYLFVDDARALYAEWRAAGVGGRLHAPTDTDYGLCEGAHVDPDGNLLRFGSGI